MSERKNTLTEEEILSNPMLASLKENAANYGIKAKIARYKVDEDKADSGYYVIAGLGDYPDYNNPREIEDDMHRNDNLFYPKKFCVKLTPENIQFAIEEFYSYCQQAELINELYQQYELEVPDVLRINEVYNLFEFYQAYDNPDFDEFYKLENKMAIQEFFDSEKKAQKKNGPTRKWKEFYRSDLYDSRKSQKQWLVGFAFNGDKDQIVPLPILTDCCKNITRMELTEAEYQELKEKLKKYPKIFYSAGEKTTIDEGDIVGNDKPWAGKETYFEYRDIFFKKVDEPIITGEVFNIRYGDLAKSRYGLADKDVVPKYISTRYMENFSTQAAQKNLYFAIDTKGEFKKGLVDKVPILVKRDQMYIFNAIMENINSFHTQYHAFIEEKESLAQKLKKASDRYDNQVSGAIGPIKKHGLEL